MSLPTPFDPLSPAVGFFLAGLAPSPAWQRGGVAGWCGLPTDPQVARVPGHTLECADDPDEEEDLGDEEDLSVAQPLADEESSFDDFDDEFDDDFEEEENDPDWDHPDDGDEEPPPGKGTGKKK